MKNLQLIIIACLTTFSGYAQSGWTIEPQNFQYSMTVTGEALIECQSTILPDDEVGAFVNDSLRGTVTFGTDVNGNNLAFLVVYSNLSSGEMVNFRIYDSSEDAFIEVIDSLLFEENGGFGTVDEPHLFSDNNPPTALSVDSLDLSDFNMTNDTVAQLFVADIDGDVYTYSFTTGGTNDNASFTIVDNYLLLAADVDYANQTSYFIEIMANEGPSCSIADTFTLAVNNTNEAPTDITFEDDDNFINENEVVGSLVGVLLVDDATVIDSHVFELDTNATDNVSFTISGNELLSAEVFDYEEKDMYFISVLVTDAVGNEFTKLLTVDVKDVVEIDDLKANNVITPNGDGFNDIFQVPNIELFDAYEFVVFNENGNQIYRRSPSAGYNNLWDGLTTEGNELPTGVYYYKLSSAADNITFTGVVNLIRN